MLTRFSLLILIVILTLILLFGCVTERVAATRPYIITDKKYYYNEWNLSEYEFIDATGKTFLFYDKPSRFQIHDTIP